LLNDTNRAPLACDSDEITMLLKPSNETIASGGVRSLTPNRGKARFWYKKAKELGSAEASKQPGADGTAAPETAIGEICTRRCNSRPRSGGIARSRVAE
jgi:hypothetical protein